MPKEKMPTQDEFRDVWNTGIAPTSYLYDPPKGAPVNLRPPAAGKYYVVNSPTKQTDKLLPYERRFTLPIAMAISPVFGVVPVPDDVYRAAPEQAKLGNMFCIISRSGIQKRSNGLLDWDAVVVVARKFCIVRINCHLDPANAKFKIRKVLLWSKASERYEIAEDPVTKSINPEVLPIILDQYAKIEGVH